MLQADWLSALGQWTNPPLRGHRRARLDTNLSRILKTLNFRPTRAPGARYEKSGKGCRKIAPRMFGRLQLWPGC